MLGFGDDKDAFKKYFNSLSRFWKDTLLAADWLDEVFVEGNTYMFIYGHGRFSGDALSTREWRDWADQITLAFWDVKGSHSVHFLDVVGKEGAYVPYGQNRFATTSDGKLVKWIPPTAGQGNPKGNEYLWFDDDDSKQRTKQYWLETQALAFPLGFCSAPWATFISQAVSAGGLVEGFYTPATVSTFQPSGNPKPYLHRGSIIDKLAVDQQIHVPFWLYPP